VAGTARLARRLGRRIADLRETCGLTQEKLAWEAGLTSKGYLSRIESGERLPSVDVLANLADRLDVEVRDLFIFPVSGDIDHAMELVRTRGTTFARRVAKLQASKARPRTRKAS
jgi:transcriptional regulator with XRE-family HTH domain